MSGFRQKAVDRHIWPQPSFRALVHSVTIHPNGSRERFEVEVKGKLAALIGGECFPKQSVVEDTW
jgi:hypothetical protein